MDELKEVPPEQRREWLEQELQDSEDALREALTRRNKLLDEYEKYEKVAKLAEELGYDLHPKETKED